ncbi:hypothetical protein PhCBS80983_g06050 [Powellomyces hirtus]|uniref:Ubiquitin-like domain-containing protein n=1 Tax=Powellomyces hirtus TaxID=109895 RepID=A0A507DTA8_9FUNG|nr:hypothetical protein PhCBS80983_g06050 [Powellomyces hirtus]
MNLTLNPADELAFAKSFLTQVGVKSRRYPQTHEPRPSECTYVLPPASRPFPLRDASTTTTTTPTTDTDIELTIKPLKGVAPFTVRAARLGPIGDIKARIATASGIPVAAQRLVYKGKGLVDSKTLLDYDIAQGATVHLMSKPIAATPESASPVAEKVAATKDGKEVLRETLKRKGEEPALWTDLRRTLGAHFEHKTDVEAVFNEFVKTYHGLCGPLTPAQRDALKKAESSLA